MKFKIGQIWLRNSKPSGSETFQPFLEVEGTQATLNAVSEHTSAIDYTINSMRYCGSRHSFKEFYTLKPKGA